MQGLQYKNGKFEWVDINYNHDTNCSGFYKVKDDVRNKYVKCNHCGKYILNTPEAIEAHYKEKEDLKPKKCMDCSRARYVRSGNSVYAQNPDGTYVCTFPVILECGYCNKIENENDVNKHCRYMDCRRAGVYVVGCDDLTSKYHDLYDVFATERSLIENGFELHRVDNDRRIYKVVNKNLYAHVATNGVVLRFMYQKYSSRTYFRYSHTHKLFLTEYNHPIDLEVQLGKTSTKFIMAKMKKLFK